MKYADNPIDTITPLTLVKRFPMNGGAAHWIARTTTPTTILVAWGACPREAAEALGRKLDDLQLDPVDHPTAPELGDTTKAVGGFDGNTTD